MKKATLILFAILTFAVSAKADYQDDCINKYRNSIGIDPFTFCPLDESKKLMSEIDGYYKELADVKFLEKWNNGNKMAKGNLKDLRSSWITYRNKMCSLVGTFWSTVESDDGTLEKQQASCLLHEVKTHHAYLRNMVKNKNSTPYMDSDANPHGHYH